MSQFPKGSAEDLTMVSATHVVHAVANARLRGHEEDAATVISAYLDESLARGLRISTCWTLLFSAAANEFTTAISVIANDRHISPDAALGDMAVAFALTER